MPSIPPAPPDGKGKPKITRAAKPLGLPAHREDPIRKNPFPPGDPDHVVWEAATREAEGELFEFEARMLGEQPAQSGLEYGQWCIRVTFGTMQVWARRGLCHVRDYQDVRAYERWLHRYLERTMRRAAQMTFALGVPREWLLPELRVQLTRALKHWAAIAIKGAQKYEAELPARAKEQSSAPGGAAEPAGVEVPPASPAVPTTPEGSDALPADPGLQQADPVGSGADTESGDDTKTKTGKAGRPEHPEMYDFWVKQGEPELDQTTLDGLVKRFYHEKPNAKNRNRAKQSIERFRKKRDEITLRNP